MVNVYCDGACSFNGCQGATASWSFLATNEDNMIIQISAGTLEGNQDSNRAELMSVIKALEYIAITKKIAVIYTDYNSVYAYMHGKNNPKQNLDLYQRIDDLLFKHKILAKTKIEKVKAHSENEDNVNIYSIFNSAIDIVASNTSKIFKTKKEENICQD